MRFQATFAPPPERVLSYGPHGPHANAVRLHLRAQAPLSEPLGFHGLVVVVYPKGCVAQVFPERGNEEK